MLCKWPHHLSTVKNFFQITISDKANYLTIYLLDGKKILF